MPHRCIRCGTMYESNSPKVLEGCDCGSKMFFFVKKTPSAESSFKSLTKLERLDIERDIFEIMGDEFDSDKPIVLDFESVRVLSPGKYELDVVNLFKKKNPLVYKLEDGKYFIDLKESLDRI